MRRADVGGLRARADGGDPRAYMELVSLLVRQGDAVRLRALALAIDDDTAAWALASVHLQRGEADEAAAVLHALVPTDLDPTLRRVADDLADQLDLNTLRQVLTYWHAQGKPAGVLSAAEWIVIAVSAGVLGNAAYAALAAAISKLRIPPPRPGTNDVVVTMYTSSRTIQPGPTRPRRAKS